MAGPIDTRYAIAVEDGPDLRLFMWVKHAAKGDVYVFWKTTDDDWTPDATYHVDGTRHLKSHGVDRILPSKGQPLTAAFVGSEQLITAQSASTW